MHPWTPVIKDEAWRKTETIIQWLFAHAQRYTTAGMGDKRQQEFEDQISRVRAFIRKAGDRGATMREVHRSLGQKKGSSAEMREACVRELEKRNEVVIRRQGNESTSVQRAVRFVVI